ncbi:hypothetical protein MINTM005_13470 [Mycobacterium intracellulare]|nr:hypothetical protein MINTM005_13470 [Mycobacterium intracellulare]
MAGEKLNDIGRQIYRAYYSTTYRASKAILSPVVGAFSDVIQETVAAAVHEGVKDAIRQTTHINVGNIVSSGLDFLRKK